MCIRDSTWAGIGYVVVCSTFLSYFMVPVGQRYLRPTVVSMYNYVQPLVAVLFTVAVGLDKMCIRDSRNPDKN